MAESNEPAPAVNVDDDVDTTPGYKPPAEKSMDEMLNLDQEDESLQKYKQSLLGDAKASTFCKPTLVTCQPCQLYACCSFFQLGIISNLNICIWSALSKISAQTELYF